MLEKITQEGGVPALEDGCRRIIPSYLKLGKKTPLTTGRAKSRAIRLILTGQPVDQETREPILALPVENEIRQAVLRCLLEQNEKIGLEQILAAPELYPEAVFMAWSGMDTGSAAQKTKWAAAWLGASDRTSMAAELGNGQDTKGQLVLRKYEQMAVAWAESAIGTGDPEEFPSVLLALAEYFPAGFSVAVASVDAHFFLKGGAVQKDDGAKVDIKPMMRALSKTAQGRSELRKNLESTSDRHGMPKNWVAELALAHLSDLDEHQEIVSASHEFLKDIRNFSNLSSDVAKSLMRDDLTTTRLMGHMKRFAKADHKKILEAMVDCDYGERLMELANEGDRDGRPVFPEISVLVDHIKMAISMRRQNNVKQVKKG